MTNTLGSRLISFADTLEIQCEDGVVVVPKKLWCFYFRDFGIMLDLNSREAKEGFGPVEGMIETVHDALSWLCRGRVENEANPLKWSRLTNLWVFANRYDSIALMRDVINAMQIWRSSSGHYPTQKALRNVFGKVHPSSAVWRYMMDLLTQHMMLELDDQRALVEACADILPPNFLQQNRLARDDQLTNIDSEGRFIDSCPCCCRRSCQYHDHPDVEDKKQSKSTTPSSLSPQTVD